jgi:hypothetical protein
MPWPSTTRAFHLPFPSAILELAIQPSGTMETRWVTQMLRQSDAQVFKKYSQMKLQMKREALGKLNRRANEITPVATEVLLAAPMCTVAVQ